ncbi:hypothetical protein [Planotetraspora phitsanulokensis]|uniref:Uncharacterized protein n=1 Tax=Planotetraspora phitsanulokensis TaxID=575192 RepID=A0A8J3UCB5_9ACTN|nr:hypothetical protein [Planotetraspora phitsanulokensis]GII42849.1 hypothetical protein Pph01_78520 [Planotetraspora phitsanulokensis]
MTNATATPRSPEVDGLLRLIATHANQHLGSYAGDAVKRVLVEALDGDHDEAERLIAHAERMRQAPEYGEDIAQ